MFFDVDELDQKQCYKLLTATVVPRPIAWVVTLNADGSTNAAPFSFFNFFSGYPPVICLGIGRHGDEPKDTMRNIREQGEFVINLVNEETVEQMNLCSINFPPGQSEISAAGLSTGASTKVKPPHIAASPVAIECRLSRVMDIDTTAFLVIGHVVGIHIRDDAVTRRDKQYIDTTKLNLIGRLESPGWYTRTRDRFKLRQFTYDEWLSEANKSNADKSNGDEGTALSASPPVLPKS